MIEEKQITKDVFQNIKDIREDLDRLMGGEKGITLDELSDKIEQADSPAIIG